jgi:pectate lyase
LNIFKGSGAGARNVIIHNLTFTNTTPDRNAISLEYGVRDVWMDHNTFKANSDGGIGQGVAVWARSVIPLAWTGITISWNHFKLPNKKAVLIGAEVGVDGNTMKVSLHHNWFEGIASRSPRIHHHAIVHMWNNYSNNWSEYAVGAGDKAEVLLENNSFENSASRYAVSASYGGPSNSRRAW